jgi:copper(I)-binding protein
MHRPMKTLRLIAAAGALVLASQAQAAPPVKVEGAWCRPTTAGAPSAGCYLTLTAARADSLVAVSSPAAERVEVHSMDMAGDVMRMKKLESLDLPAGKAVALKPGGLHLMLIRPKAVFAAGGQVPLSLKFAKAPALMVQAPVRNPAPAAGHHHQH